VAGRIYTFGAATCERSEAEPATNFLHRKAMLIKTTLFLYLTAQKRKKNATQEYLKSPWITNCSTTIVSTICTAPSAAAII